MTPSPAWARIDGSTITAEVDRQLALQRLAERSLMNRIWNGICVVGRWLGSCWNFEGDAR